MKKTLMDIIKVIVSVLIADVVFVAVTTFDRLPKLDINTIQTFFETLVNAIVSAWTTIQFAFVSTMNGTVKVKVVLIITAVAIMIYKLVDAYAKPKEKTEKTVEEHKVDPAT